MACFSSGAHLSYSFPMDKLQISDAVLTDIIKQILDHFPVFQS